MLNYGPLIKWSLIVAAFAAFCVGLIAYGEYRKQLEWDASIGTQAILSASQIIAQAVNTAAVEVRYIKVKGATRTVTQTVEKEVIRYVDSPTTKCVLAPEFVLAFDHLSGLLDPDHIRVSSAAGPAGDPDESAGAVTTDAEVLRAYQAAIVQYRDLWLAYVALVEWVRTSYALHAEAEGIP